MAQGKSKSAGKSKGSKGSKVSNVNCFNIYSLASLALILISTRKSTLSVLPELLQHDIIKKDRRDDEDDNDFETRIKSQTKDWIDMDYIVAKPFIVDNVDKLIAKDNSIKALISDTALNMNVPPETELKLHALIITTLFDSCTTDNTSQQDSASTKKVTKDSKSKAKYEAVDFLKTPKTVSQNPSIVRQSNKRKSHESEPRPIRGFESDESPKRPKQKIVNDGDDAMPEVIAISPRLDHKTRSNTTSINLTSSSPKCTMTSSPIFDMPSMDSPPQCLSPLDLGNDSPNSKHASFDSSIEGLAQISECNKKIASQAKTKSSVTSGIKIKAPDSPSHPANKTGQLDASIDSPTKNPVLPSTAWSKDPLRASSVKLAWTMGGLLENSSQTPGASSSGASQSRPHQSPEPMEATPCNKKRKNDDISPDSTTNKQAKKTRSNDHSVSPPKSPKPVKNKNIDPCDKPSPRSPSGTTGSQEPRQNDKKVHPIPAFFFPRNVNNIAEFSDELINSNPGLLNGFDLGTFRNGKKYIKPRTKQIANMFKSPLTVFGILQDFVQINSDETKGHTVQVVKVPFSRNTCKSFDNNTNINWIRIRDIRKNVDMSKATCTLVINFKTLAPPNVYIGRFSFPTSDFKPEPKRCTKCQHFGHYKKQCNHSTVCTFCSGQHESDVCYQKKVNGEAITLKCTNCQGPHAASSRKCPKHVAALHSLTNRPLSEHTTTGPNPIPPPQSKPSAPSDSITSTEIPRLMDFEFPPLSRSRTNHLHIPFNKGLKHGFSGDLEITLHLLRQISIVHPTAKLAIGNLAFSIGGERFRDTVRIDNRH